MKTVLYINNDKIQILSVKLIKGQTVIQNQILIELESESIVNGVIINREPIVEKLVLHKKLLKNATVIINSSNIFAKKLDFPNLSDKQLLRVIKSEFSLTDDGNVLYDTNVYNKKGINTVICCAAPMELVESYINLFKAAKIMPARIDITQNSIVKFVRTKVELQEKTFVLNIVEGSNLVSVLFENGEYVLTNRSRILAENTGSEYTEQIFSKLSTIIQFNKSEKSSNEIEASYYVGLDATRLEQLQAYSARIVGDIEVKGIDEIIDVEGFSGDFFYPFMGLFDKKNDMNILERYKKGMVDRKIEKDKPLTRVLSAVILVILMVFGSFGYYKINNYLYETDHVRMTHYLSQEAVGQNLKSILTKERRNKEIPATFTEIAMALKKADKGNGINSSKLISIFTEAQKSVILENLVFDAQKKTVVITGKGLNEYSSSIFTTNLKVIGLFEKVDYSGYSSNKNNEYTFSVVCTLK